MEEEKKKYEMSPKAFNALWQIVNLRQLPETEKTVTAERRLLETLNVTDTRIVANLLAPLYFKAGEDKRDAIQAILEVFRENAPQCEPPAISLGVRKVGQ